MKNKIFFWILGLIIFLIIIVNILFFSGVFNGNVVKNNEKTIKIGVLFPFSGKIASIGDSMRDAVELAHSNSDNIELIYQDEECDAEKAVSAYRALRLQGVRIIIGAGCSSSTVAVAPIAESEKVLLFTPLSSADVISKMGDYIFRNHEFASQKAGKIAEFASTKYKTAAIIYDATSDAYVSSQKIFADNFKGDTLDVESFQKNANDYRSQLIKIKEKNPEAIVVFALMPDSGLIIKQMNELGIKSQIIGEDGLVLDSDFIKAVGNLSNGIIFAGTKFDRESSPEFFDAFNKKYGKDPRQWDAQAYDNYMILKKIINEKCHDGDPTCIKNEIYKIQNYKGASGILSFDSNGDARKDVAIQIINNGRIEDLNNEK